MPSDQVLSQAEIDAMVSKVPQKPGTSPVTNDVAPAIKLSQSSSPSAVTNDVASASKPSQSSSPSAQPETDSLPARLARLESDFAIVKSEMQSILLDLREKYLEAENPFNALATPNLPPANTRRTDTRS